jgi:hypothetical protein
MGKHKERTGNTRLGKILQGIGKALPDLAGDVFNVVTSPNPFGAVMDTLKGKLASKLTGAVGDNFNNEIDNLTQDDKELFLASLADVKDARDMYKTTGHEQADKIAENIMKRNLPYIVIMASVNVLVLLFAETFDLSTAVVLAVGNVIGMVIQSLINERAQVVGFYMGSSIGSKLKDKARSMFNNN